MNRYLPTSLLFASTLFAIPALASESQDLVRYRATVQNLTAFNLISPPISLVHKPESNLFQTGTAATPGLAQLAESGQTTIIQEELAANPIVISVSKAEGGPLAAAEKRSIEFTVSRHDIAKGARFTILGMIGRSNDSFVAFKNIELRDVKKGKYFKVRATNYDAGSEENTGNLEDLNATNHPTEFAEGHISYDRGLNSKGNAPEYLGWAASKYEEGQLGWVKVPLSVCKTKKGFLIEKKGDKKVAVKA